MKKHTWYTVVLATLLSLALLVACGGETTENVKDEGDAVPREEATIEGDHAGDVEDAVAAADLWLAMIQFEEYERSYDEAGDAITKALTKEQWVDTMKTLRTKLGALEGTRTRITNTYTTSIPGLPPEGKYVDIFYVADYASGKGRVERVIMTKTPDDVWRSVTYVIIR